MDKIDIYGKQVNIIGNVESYEVLKAMMPFSSNIENFRMEEQYSIENLGTLYYISKLIDSKNILEAVYFVPDRIKHEFNVLYNGK